MSYDLGVWHAARPMATEEAGQVYLKLCDGDVSQVPAHPSIASFLAELTRTYPEIDDWDEGDIDNCPWNAAFDKSDGHVLMCVAYSRANEIVPFVESLAGKHGLVCYNPQGPYVAYPPSIAAIPHLRLILENWTVLDNPAPAGIAASLASLREANSFAVLEVTDSTYIQTALQPNGDYVVEYREGSADRHFRALTSDLAAVIAAFQAYAAGDETWRSAFDWSRITL